MANSMTILILFLVGIRSLQTALIGSIRMVISETTLNKREIIALVLLFRHRYSVISGFQSASRGEQAKIVRKVLIVYHTLMTMITTLALYHMKGSTIF